MKERLVWIDWVKSICIISMVMGHTYGFAPDYFRILHGSISIQVFFIVSGFLYKPKSLNYLFKTIVVPYLFCLFLMVLGILFIEGKSILELYHDYSLIAYKTTEKQTVVVGNWFLFALFFLRLLLADNGFTGILFKYHRYISTICIIFTIILYFFKIEYGIYYFEWLIPIFPLMSFGIEYNTFKDTFHFSKKWWHYCLLIGLTVISIFMNSAGKECHPFACSFGTNYLWYYINSILGFFSLKWICEKLPRVSFIETLSKGTILILCLHFPILQWLLKVVLSVIPGKLYSLTFLIASFLTLVILYGIILLVDRFLPWANGRR